MSSERIEELKRQIAELQRRWPAHSTPPTMIQQLDQLEEELEGELQSSRGEASWQSKWSQWTIIGANLRNATGVSALPCLPVPKRSSGSQQPMKCRNL